MKIFYSFLSCFDATIKFQNAKQPQYSLNDYVKAYKIKIQIILNKEKKNETIENTNMKIIQ